MYNVFLNKYHANILFKINIDLKIVCFLFIIKELQMYLHNKNLFFQTVAQCELFH
jgi:hypothetical protein